MFWANLGASHLKNHPPLALAPSTAVGHITLYIFTYINFNMKYK